MEDILHQLRQVKPVNTGTFTGPYQLVQDFFHEQYEHVDLSSDVQFDIEKYMAKSLHIGIYGPSTKLPFGIPSILTWRLRLLRRAIPASK